MTGLCSAATQLRYEHADQRNLVRGLMRGWAWMHKLPSRNVASRGPNAALAQILRAFARSPTTLFSGASSLCSQDATSG